MLSLPATEFCVCLCQKKNTSFQDNMRGYIEVAPTDMDQSAVLPSNVTICAKSDIICACLWKSIRSFLQIPEEKRGLPASIWERIMASLPMPTWHSKKIQSVWECIGCWLSKALMLQATLLRGWNNAGQRRTSAGVDNNTCPPPAAHDQWEYHGEMRSCPHRVWKATWKASFISWSHIEQPLQYLSGRGDGCDNCNARNENRQPHLKVLS